jgi:N-acetylneuraminate lyase
MHTSSERDPGPAAAVIEIAGVVPALFTAYDDSGVLAPERQVRLVEHLLDAGVHGLFVGGSTGEFTSLSEAERRELAEVVVAATAGVRPVVVHVGSFDAEVARRLARHAGQIGAAAIATLPPLFYPASETTLLEHLARLAATVDLPLYLYHFPQRAALELTESLVAGLVEIPTFAGLKFTHGDLFELWRVRHWSGGRLQVLSGFDEILLSALAAGAGGAVGSTYNLLAPHFVELWAAWSAGRVARAQELQHRANRIIDVLLRWQPAAVLSASKAALECLGLSCGDPRPPLRRFSDQEKQALWAALRSAGFPAEGSATPG